MSTIRRAPRRALLIPLALAALGGLAACGDDGDDTAAAAAPPTTHPEDHADDHADPTTPSSMTVEVGAVDYAFQDLPATVAPGTALSLTNSSTNEVHELVAVRIPDDEHRSIDELMALPETELDALFGAALPALVIVAGPGEEGGAVVGDGTLTEPGRYAVVCAIPLGADPDEFFAAAAEGEGDGPPDVEGGPPHFTAGMYAELIVEEPLPLRRTG